MRVSLADNKQISSTIIVSAVLLLLLFAVYCIIEVVGVVELRELVV